MTLKRVLACEFSLVLLLCLFTEPASGQVLLRILDDPTPQAGAHFGVSLAALGDVDGDGVPDIAVGAYYQYVGGNPTQGQVFIFSGADGSLLRTLNEPTAQRGAQFGYLLAGVGDVDVDGVPDIAVVAFGKDVGGYGDVGQAFVFSGADGSLLRTLNDPTPQVGAGFGYSLAAVGDVDGDRVPDITVGAFQQKVGGNASQGQVFVFSGADGSLLRTLDDPTPQAGAHFGSSLAGVGDVDSDGVPDIAVGAHFQKVDVYSGVGQAFVFSGANGLLLRTLNDPTPEFGYLFGFQLAGVGDVDGDGVPDIAVGACGQKVGGNLSQGQVFVFSGADGLLLRTLDDPTPQAKANFGSHLAGVGDVDGDGVPDIAVGAYGQKVGDNLYQGQVFVFSGADGSLLRTLDDPTPQDQATFGQALAGVGDMDGDRVPDIAVGAPWQKVGANSGQGQVFIFLSGGPQDTTAPETTIALSGTAGKNGWYISDVTVTLTATDENGGSGVASTVYSLDGGANWKTYTGPFVLSNEGTATVLFYSTDNAGNIEDPPGSQLVKIDKTPPIVNASRTPGSNASGWNNTDVSVMFTASDAVSGVDGASSYTIVVSQEGTNQSVSYTFTDMAGNSTTSTSDGINIDKTPPVISGLPTTPCILWPPDHKLVQVAMVTADGGLSGLVSLVVTGTSNEPENGLGDGDTAPDIVITGGTVLLRAERSGTGTGRIYTITAIATDGAGNTMTTVTTCTVPRDKRN